MAGVPRVSLVVMISIPLHSDLCTYFYSGWSKVTRLLYCDTYFGQALKSTIEMFKSMEGGSGPGRGGLFGSEANPVQADNEKC